MAHETMDKALQGPSASTQANTIDYGGGCGRIG